MSLASLRVKPFVTSHQKPEKIDDATCLGAGAQTSRLSYDIPDSISIGTLQHLQPPDSDRLTPKINLPLEPQGRQGATHESYRLSPPYTVTNTKTLSIYLPSLRIPARAPFELGYNVKILRATTIPPRTHRVSITPSSQQPWHPTQQRFHDHCCCCRPRVVKQQSLR